ncbi:hypothetical protein WDW86_01615 [Bdellovibrionota bacterium FG-2]
MANVKRVFEGTNFDDTPQEFASFDSNHKVLRFDVDTRDDGRKTLEFSEAIGFQYQPSAMVDRSEYFVGGEYVNTVLEVEGSDWIASLHSFQERLMEPISTSIRHFILLSDDGVWQILASNCYPLTAP